MGWSVGRLNWTCCNLCAHSSRCLNLKFSNFQTTTKSTADGSYNLNWNCSNCRFNWKSIRIHFALVCIVRCRQSSDFCVARHTGVPSSSLSSTCNFSPILKKRLFFISKTTHTYKVEQSSVLEVAMAVVNRSIYLTFYRTSHFEWFVYKITSFFGCSRFTFITILFLESIYMGIWCFCGSEIENYKHSRDIYVLCSSRHTSKTK